MLRDILDVHVCFIFSSLDMCPLNSNERLHTLSPSELAGDSVSLLQNHFNSQLLFLFGWEHAQKLSA